MSKRVFVNAWDCWSALGNGNYADRSADGFWGRSTAILLLGWPRSNPDLRYEAAPTPGSEPGSSAAADSAFGPALRTCAFKRNNAYLAVEKGKLILSKTKHNFYYDPNATGRGTQLYVGGPYLLIRFRFRFGTEAIFLRQNRISFWHLSHRKRRPIDASYLGWCSAHAHGK